MDKVLPLDEDGAVPATSSSGSSSPTNDGPDDLPDTRLRPTGLPSSSSSSSSSVRLRPVRTSASSSSSSTVAAPEPPRMAWGLSGGKPSMSSQDYESSESEVARVYHQQHSAALFRDAGDHHDDEEEDDDVRAQKALQWQTRKRSFLRWLIILLMAVVIETIYLFISYSSANLLKHKANFMLHAPTPGAKYGIKLFFSLLYAAVAFGMVYLVPTSAGSGIPETKAFLNGIRIPNMQSLRTLAAKALGTIFAVAAGLPLGKYGAMIHIGSIVAACMSRGARGFIRPVDRLLEAARIFSTHSEKRDLVVAGAAAGVTAAFGAPIGGLMLAWEEGSSYWSLKVSWRVFFCAMATLLFTYLVAGMASINQSYLQSYAGSFSTGIRVANRDLLVFAGMGVLGGILGGSFNGIHKRMSSVRARWVATWPRRLAEVLAVTFLVITVGFLASYLSEGWACRPLPPRDPGLYEDAAYVVPYFDGLLRLTCPPAHYNEVASLYLNDGVTALRLLFHLPRLNLSDGLPMFSLAALALFVVPYFLFLVLTFGIAVPCGFFVPQLLLGAVLGRMAGEVMIGLGYPTYFGQVRIFAIMGSAAFVGGICRMVLSMTVIMLEATGDLFFLLPFGVVLLTAHWVGNFFGPSIYDMLIQMKGYPFLRPDPPKWASGRLRASDLMTREVVTLRPIESVKRLREVLYATEHNMFPLLYPASHPTRPGALFGTIMRETLVVLVQAAAFSFNVTVDADPDSPDVASPVLSYPQLLQLTARLSSRAIARPSLPLSTEEETKWVDLRPYSNPSVYYVTEDSSVTKVYRVFRGLGLRHLLVLNVARDISGIITRHDLMPESMKARLEEIRAGTRASKIHWSLPVPGQEGVRRQEGVGGRERGQAKEEEGPKAHSRTGMAMKTVGGRAA